MFCVFFRADQIRKMFDEYDKDCSGSISVGGQIDALQVEHAYRWDRVNDCDTWQEPWWRTPIWWICLIPYSGMNNSKLHTILINQNVFIFPLSILDSHFWIYYDNDAKWGWMLLGKPVTRSSLPVVRCEEHLLQDCCQDEVSWYLMTFWGAVGCLGE